MIQEKMGRCVTHLGLPRSRGVAERMSAWKFVHTSSMLTENKINNPFDDYDKFVLIKCVGGGLTEADSCLELRREWDLLLKVPSFDRFV